MDVAIQVPAYDEPPRSFERTLELIAAQPVPDGVTVSLEAWITPAGADDPSVDVATGAGFDAFEAPSGKLAARNAAHDHAMASGADAIVSWDADAPPLSDRTLLSLTAPLLEPTDAVAVNAQPRSVRGPGQGPSVFGVLVDLGATVEDVLFPHFHGQCSSFTAEAWRAAGPFDTSMDQTDDRTVRAEEEFYFYRRLQSVGRVASPLEATVYNDPRRHFCRVAPWAAPEGYCSRIGNTTFAERS